MTTLSILSRFSSAALLSCGLLVGCSHPTVATKKATEPCYTNCVDHMHRCQRLCKEANEECKGNAAYMKTLNAQGINLVGAKNNAAFSQSCNTHCGCIPSKTICSKVCLPK